MQPSNNSSIILPDGSPYDSREFRLPLFIEMITFCGCAVVLVATLFNLAVVVTFARRPRLITTFTVNVLNNSVLGIFAAAVFSPMFLYRNLDREIYRHKGYCAVYKYLNWTLPSMLLMQHVIICKDRWMAILRPVWYRERQSVRMGFVSTGVAFLYVQVWYLPIFVTDTILPLTSGTYCDNTAALPRYQLVVRLAIALLPVLIMDLSYPFLLYMVWRRARSPVVPALEPTNHHNQNRTRDRPGKIQQRHQMGLALWLLSVQILLWTPSNVTSMLIGLHSQLYYLYDVPTFAVVLSGVLLLADPIIYLVFLKDLRQELLSGLRVCFTKIFRGNH